MEIDNFYIAIAGNIGSGKTTLSKQLGKEMDMHVYEEPVRDNPFLKPFYVALKEFTAKKDKHTKANMQEAGYALQEFFLLNRVLDHKKIMMMERSVIQDRSIYEDNKIFAKNAYQSGYMNKAQYLKYQTLYKMLASKLKAPDMLIYLETSEDILKSRIQKRIDEDPSRITEEELVKEENKYLQGLNELYEEWFKTYDEGPKIKIDTDIRNFEEHPEDLEFLVREMKRINPEIK